MIISAASQQTFCSAGENQDLFPGSSPARNSTGRNISDGRHLAVELTEKIFESFQWWKYFSFKCWKYFRLKCWKYLIVLSVCSVCRDLRVTWLTSGLWSLCVSLLSTWEHWEKVWGDRGTKSSDLPAIKPTSRIYLSLYLLPSQSCPCHRNVIWLFLHHPGLAGKKDWRVKSI